MKRKIGIVAVLSLFSFVAGMAGAQEIREGRVKLELLNRYGRFSLSYLDDLQSDRYSSFLLDDDPRTSHFNVLVDNKVYRLGESYQFEQKVESSGDNPVYLWQSSFLSVRMEFDFVASRKAALPDGLIISTTLTNLAQNSKSVGLKVLFDTWLGENVKNHFYTENDYGIDAEIDYQGRMPVYWVSGPEESPTRLQVMLRGQGVTEPDRLLFANWKRLDDASWEFDSSRGRSFSMLPYSRNDSAVCHYYNPLVLEPGEERTVVIIMGQYSPEGYSAVDEAEDDLSELYSRTAEQSVNAETDDKTAIRQELLSVEDYLAKIERILEAGGDITDDELATLTEIMKSLEARKAGLLGD